MEGETNLIRHVSLPPTSTLRPARLSPGIVRVVAIESPAVPLRWITSPAVALRLPVLEACGVDRPALGKGADQRVVERDVGAEDGG